MCVCYLDDGAAQNNRTSLHFNVVFLLFFICGFISLRRCFQCRALEESLLFLLWFKWSHIADVKNCSRSWKALPLTRLSVFSPTDSTVLCLNVRRHPHTRSVGFCLSYLVLFEKRLFFSLPSIQVHLFRSLSSLWFWENFFASPHKLLVLFFFWFSQIKTSVRSRGDNKGTAADLLLQRWSVSEDKKAAGVTRVDRDEAAGEKSLISLSQVELSLSADGGRSVVLFLSELFKGAESDSGECVESRSRVVNYRCVDFPKLSNIDSFYDNLQSYVLRFYRFNRFYNSYRCFLPLSGSRNQHEHKVEVFAVRVSANLSGCVETFQSEAFLMVWLG